MIGTKFTNEFAPKFESTIFSAKLIDLFDQVNDSSRNLINFESSANMVAYSRGPKFGSTDLSGDVKQISHFLENNKSVS